VPRVLMAACDERGRRGPTTPPAGLAAGPCRKPSVLLRAVAAAGGALPCLLTPDAPRTWRAPPRPG